MDLSEAAGHVSRHYDRLDAFYREVWGEHMHHGLWRTGRETLEQAKLALLSAVAEAAQIAPGQRVLDLGCGYGAPARWLAAERGVSVLAITNSPAQYAYAASEGSEHHSSYPPAAHVEYCLLNWPAALPEIPPFDAAIALESGEYFADEAELFTSLRSVLRPGGRLVLAGWLSPGERASRFVRPILRAARMPPLASAAEYTRHADAAGFTLTATEDLTRQATPTWLRMGWVFLRQALRRPRLLYHLAANWRFAFAALRITFAFRTGHLRYGILRFTAR